MLSACLLGLACFCKVFLAGLQTKNVQHSRVLLAAGTSLLMSSADVVVIKMAAFDKTVVVLLVMGVANAAGIALAIAIHDHVLDRR